MNDTCSRMLVREADFTGEFYEPAGKTGTGLVIVPSSAGVQDVRERAYADFLARRGIFCCIADAFTLRGVTECLTDQTRLRSDVLMAQAVLAAERLRAKGCVRVGILGVSKGGSVALHAALRHPWFPGAPDFAFHVALAPPVALQLRHVRARGGPVFVLLGEKDDFTPAAPAREYAERIAAANPGLQLHCRTVAGASHAWESRGGLRFLASAESYAHCRFLVEDDGTVTDAATGRNMTRAVFFRGLRAHARHGAHYGGGDDALFSRTCLEILRFIRGSL